MPSVTTVRTARTGSHAEPKRTSTEQTEVLIRPPWDNRLEWISSYRIEAVRHAEGLSAVLIDKP